MSRFLTTLMAVMLHKVGSSRWPALLLAPPATAARRPVPAGAAAPRTHVCSWGGSGEGVIVRELEGRAGQLL